MSMPTTTDLVDAFTEEISRHLDESRLDGPVRMDNTHTVVIVPIKGKGQIHAHVQGGISDEGVDNVLHQISSVPSLKTLVKNH